MEGSSAWNPSGHRVSSGGVRVDRGSAVTVVVTVMGAVLSLAPPPRVCTSAYLGGMYVHRCETRACMDRAHVCIFCIMLCFLKPQNGLSIITRN